MSAEKDFVVFEKSESFGDEDFNATIGLCEGVVYLGICYGGKKLGAIGFPNPITIREIAETLMIYADKVEKR